MKKKSKMTQNTHTHTHSKFKTHERKKTFERWILFPHKSFSFSFLLGIVTSNSFVHFVFFFLLFVLFCKPITFSLRLCVPNHVGMLGFKTLFELWIGDCLHELKWNNIERKRIEKKEKKREHSETEINQMFIYYCLFVGFSLSLSSLWSLSAPLPSLLFFLYRIVI